MRRLFTLFSIATVMIQGCGDRLDKDNKIEILGIPVKIEFFAHIDGQAFEYKNAPVFVITDKDRLTEAFNEIINASDPEPMKGGGLDKLVMHYKDTIVILFTDKARIGFAGDGPFYHLPENNFIINNHADTSVNNADSIVRIQDSVSLQKPYSNARFRNVTVVRVGVHKFLISGEGQIFEANFGWVVEDGHHELVNGFEMTDAGAPEWGDFEFTVEVEKQRPNSTLTLILFETSAMDGSRQHELPVVLE